MSNIRLSMKLQLVAQKYRNQLIEMIITNVAWERNIRKQLALLYISSCSALCFV